LYWVYDIDDIQHCGVNTIDTVGIIDAGGYNNGPLFFSGTVAFTGVKLMEVSRKDGIFP